MIFIKKQKKFDIISATEVILCAGSIIEPLKPSARADVINKRKQAIQAGLLNETTREVVSDLHFKSLSGCASFAEGGSVSGTVYFKAVIQNTSQAKPSGTCTASFVHPSQLEEETSAEGSAVDTIQDNECDPSINEPELTPKEKLRNAITSYINKLTNLLSGVNYKCIDTPLLNYRTINNLLFTQNLDDASAVLENFILLTGGCDEQADEVKNLMHSYESERDYNEILKEIETAKTAGVNLKRINNRFILYYGEAGSGKTYDAIKQNESAPVIVATSDACGSDLFSHFDIKTKTRTDSIFATAMKTGSKIIIDELRLYPDDVLTRLQGILDNKNYIIDEMRNEENGEVISAHRIDIKEGFQVIATMNLTCPLPPALVSRAIIKKYTMTPELIASRMF